MGHDIDMVDSGGRILSVEKHSAGGTIVIGGTTLAEISMTYNYAWFFYKFMDTEKGIKAICGLTGKKAKPIIENMMGELSTTGTGNGLSEAECNYWCPTPSNVMKILRVLLRWCEQHPKGIFKGG